MTITTAREQLDKLRILDFQLCNEMAHLFDDKTYEASARRYTIATQLRNQVRPRIAECVKYIALHS